MATHIHTRKEDVREDWVLEGDGMATPLLKYCMLRGLMGGARLLGLEGEVTRRVGRGAPSLSESRLYLLRQAASN